LLKDGVSVWPSINRQPPGGQGVRQKVGKEDMGTGKWDFSVTYADVRYVALSVESRL